MKKIKRELKRAFPFASIPTTTGNHFRIRLPDGQSVFAGSTPSDRRSMKNVRSEVHRRMNAKADGPKTAE